MRSEVFILFRAAGEGKLCDSWPWKWIGKNESGR